MIIHIGFFGDGTHAFALTDAMIAELERLTGKGIGAIYQRAVRMEFNGSDLAEIIRLGLIGAGTSPQEAKALTDAYAADRPMAETYPLALDILDARWNGIPETKGESA